MAYYCVIKATVIFYEAIVRWFYIVLSCSNVIITNNSCSTRIDMDELKPSINILQDPIEGRDKQTVYVTL